MEMPIKSILLVEDSMFLRKANERTLIKAGYSVVVASDGEEGLRLACATIPDLILLDMLLPKLSGEQVLQALRSYAPTALIPVIVLSSLPQTNENKLKKAGANAYFEKSQWDGGQGSESLINVVKKTLEDATNANEQRVPVGSQSASKDSPGA
jgi:CheY-like chemotaxis protein